MPSAPSHYVYEQFGNRLCLLQDWIRTYGGDSKEADRLKCELQSGSILDIVLGTRMTRVPTTNFEPQETGYGNFFHDVFDKELYVDNEFLDTWSTLFNGLQLDEKTRCAAIDCFVIHEFLHIPQRLGSYTYDDIESTSIVTHSADYYTDAKTALILRELYITNEYLEPKEECDPLDVLVFIIQALLRSIEVFNYPIKTITGLRFLRYFIWHYQYHRFKCFERNTEFTVLDILDEPVFDIRDIGANDDVNRNWLRSNETDVTKYPFLWGFLPSDFGKEIVRFTTTDPRKPQRMFEGIFDCDVTKSQSFFKELFWVNRFLIAKENRRFLLRKATKHDLTYIHQMAQEELAQDVSPLKSMIKWHKKNDSIFYVIVRQSESNVNDFVGFFCTIPITKSAARKLEDGRVTGANLTVRDITRASGKCDSVYIGGIAAKGMQPRYILLRALRNQLRYDWEQEREVANYYARPTTPEGFRLVHKYGFSPLRSENSDCVYKRVVPIPPRPET